MKRVLTLGLTLLVAGIAAGLLTAAPTQRKFSPRQEPTGIGNLIVPGDRVALVYEAGVKGVTGSVYVRNDRRRKFVRLGLVLDRPRSSSYRARVPRRLIRGQHLRYYAVLRRGEHRSHRKSPREGRVIGAHPRASEGRPPGDTSVRSDARAGRGRRQGVGGSGRMAAPTPGPGPEGRPAVVPGRAGPLDLAPRQLQRPHAGLERRRSEHDRALRSASGPQRPQRCRVRAEGSLYVTHGVGPRTQLPHRLEPSQRDGAASCGRRGWPATSSATRSRS